LTNAPKSDHRWRHPARHCCRRVHHGSGSGGSGNLRTPISLPTPFSDSALTAGERQNFIGAHLRICGAAQNVKSKTSTSATCPLLRSLTNARVIASQFELHFRMWQQPEPFSDLLRYGDLAFRSDLHALLLLVIVIPGRRACN